MAATAATLEMWEDGVHLVLYSQEAWDIVHMRVCLYSFMYIVPSILLF